eukprot:4277710-Pleurochrysis_carterae.AAC.1
MSGHSDSVGSSGGDANRFVLPSKQSRGASASNPWRSRKILHACISSQPAVLTVCPFSTSSLSAPSAPCRGTSSHRPLACTSALARR